MLSPADLEKILQIRQDVFCSAQFAGSKNERKRNEVLNSEINTMNISGKAKANLKSWPQDVSRALRQEAVKLSDLLNLDELACLDLLTFGRLKIFELNFPFSFELPFVMTWKKVNSVLP